jgi:hypothetical protein
MDRTSEDVVQCYSEPARFFTYRGPSQARLFVAVSGAGIPLSLWR